MAQKVTEKIFDKAICLFDHGIAAKEVAVFLNIGYSTACRIRQAGSFRRYSEMGRERYNKDPEEENAGTMFQQAEGLIQNVIEQLEMIKELLRAME